jgi:hypothetical protein
VPKRRNPTQKPDSALLKLFVIIGMVGTVCAFALASGELGRVTDGIQAVYEELRANGA